MQSLPIFINKCLGLAKIISCSFFAARILFVVLAIGWCATYAVDYLFGNIQWTVIAMVIPVLLEIVLAMMISIQASFLLANAQLYLMGVRREIFIILLIMCLGFSSVVFDPKNADHVVRAKLVAFDYLSLGILWLLWITSLNIGAIVGLIALVAAAIGLGYLTSFDVGATALAFLLWGYLWCWLRWGPLQRKFKFEDFASVVEYIIDVAKTSSIGAALRVVRCKEHVILLAEGDGYVNRLLIAPALMLLFTGGYLLLVRQYPELCLFMVLLLFMSNKAKLKVVARQSKLWLLCAGNRYEQFALSERLLIRLHLYNLVVGGVLLMLWCWVNPSQWKYGLQAFLVFQTLVFCMDYLTTFASTSPRKSFYLNLILLPCMALIVFYPLSLAVSISGVAVMCLLCAFLRSKIKQRFLQSDFKTMAWLPHRLM